MKLKNTHLRSVTAFSALIALFGMGAPLRAQSMPAQSNTPAMTTPGSDTTRAELTRFDQFLDSHHEIAEQLRKDPSLVNQGKFVKDHPALRTYLQDHPGIREELKENPSAFMRREESYDRREDARQRGDSGATRAELAQFNRFLESHREIAEQVRKNPQLVNNQPFVENHPELLNYFREHPAVREELRENPNAFMQQEDNFDRTANGRERDRDADRAEREQFDRFLDSHHEIAEQVRKNPSLINNSDFAKDHPVLEAYLQDHPEIREEARNNPNALIQGSEGNRYSSDDQTDRDRFDRRDEGHDRAADHDRAANFREFLGNHRDVAEQLSRDPSLAKDRDFMSNHPELQDYLATHPDVNRELMNNPQVFVRSAQPQQFNNNNQGSQGTKPWAFDPKTGH